MRNYPKDPAHQPTKGVFIFRASGEDTIKRAVDLLVANRCQVLATLDNRITVQTSRDNLRQMKARWQANDPADALSQTLNAQIVQIIIGGRA